MFPGYPLALDLALAAGIASSLWLAKRRGFKRQQVLDAILVALIGGILGGRLLPVFLYAEHFSTHPEAIFDIGEGGIVWIGAFWGGVLGVLGYAQWKGIAFWDLVDLLAPGLALSQGIGWMACHFAGCGYGVASYGTLAYLLPDNYGIYGYRLPIPALMSGLFILIFLALIFWPRPGTHSGFIFILYLLSSSLGQFFLEFYRADETIYFGLLRLSQMVELGGLALAVSLLYLTRRARRASHAQI